MTFKRVAWCNDIRLLIVISNQYHIESVYFLWRGSAWSWNWYHAIRRPCLRQNNDILIHIHITFVKEDVNANSRKSQQKTSHVTSLPLVPHICQRIGSALVQTMACRLLSASPWYKSVLGYCQLDVTLQRNFYQNKEIFRQENLKLSSA